MAEKDPAKDKEVPKKGILKTSFSSAGSNEPKKDIIESTKLFRNKSGSVTFVNQHGVQTEIPSQESRRASRLVEQAETAFIADLDNKYLHGQGDPLRKKQKTHNKCKLWRRRLYAILWVNMLMRVRRPLKAITELLIPPIILTFFLVSLTRNFNYKFVNRHVVKVLDPYNQLNGSSQQDLWTAFCKNPEICQKGTINKAYIVYTPQTPLTERIMKGVMKSLKLADKLVPKKNEEEVIEECTNHHLHREENRDFNGPDAIGIIFTLKNVEVPSMLKLQEPHVLMYKIRTFEPKISNTKELFPYFTDNEEHDVSPYVTTGFIGLQNAIDNTFMEVINDHLKAIASPFIESLSTTSSAFLDDVHVKFRLRMFPYTLYMDINIRSYTWFLVVFTIYLGYFLTIYFRAKQTIMDRQSGIMEILKLHGMPCYMDRLVVLFNDGLLRGITAVFLVLILYSTMVKDAGFHAYDHPILVWFFFVLHGVANIAFTFCVALMFDKATFGACFTFLVGFVSFFLPMSLFNTGWLQSKSVNMFLCLIFPNWSLANGLFNFLKFESLENKQTWFSASTWADTDNYFLFPVFFCCILLVITCILYSFLAVYIENVTKNPLSTKESYLFCFKQDKNYVEFEEEDDDYEIPPIFEPESEPVLVKCRNLTYTYDKSHIGLDDVSIDIHENQVTILLGKSGSGKSTLIQMMTGLVKPTRGYVRLKSMPFNDDPENLRHYVGYAPQTHILYDTLTVQESIRLCCMLHGMEHMVARKQATALMIRFNLFLSKNVGVKHLTECQKRKLSIAMAFTSNPAVLVLDEPTCGMTPAEKREIWYCIRILRTGRCIVVTANTMEEADLYGDRIILMAKGRILCAGSTTFLQTLYPTGCYLKLRKEEGGDMDIDGIIEVLHGITKFNIHPVHPPHATTGHGREVYFPLGRSIPYSVILEALEEARHTLGIYHMSVTHNSLTGVLENIMNKPEFDPDDASLAALAHHRDSVITFNSNFPRRADEAHIPPEVVKDPNWCLTMYALFTKQIECTVQTIALFYQYLVPLILLAIFVLCLPTYLAVQPKDVPLKLTVDTYAHSLFPIWLSVHGANEHKTWTEAADDVSGDTQGRNVHLDPTVAGEEQFKKMLWPAIGSRTKYEAQVTVGVTRDHSYFSGYYASNALHAAPCAQNYMSNLMLYFLTPSLDKPVFVGDEDMLRKEFPVQIITFNHPINVKEGRTGTVRDAINSILGIVFAFILGMLAAAKLSYCLTERVTGLKNLQMTTGVSPFQYWTVTFLCDVCTNIVLTVLVTGVFCVFEISTAFDGVETRISIYFLTLLFLSWSSLSYGYLCTMVMTDKYTAYGQYMAMHILTGMIPEIFNTLIIERWVSDSNVICFFNYLFILFPAYSINSGFVRLVGLISENDFCNREPAESRELCRTLDTFTYDKKIKVVANDLFVRSCCDEYCKSAKTCFKPRKILENFWAKDDLTIYGCLMSMLFQGIFYWIILLIVDYKIFQRCAFRMGNFFTGDIDKLEAQNITGLNIDAELGKGIDADLYPEESDDENPKNEVVMDVQGITKYFKLKRVLNHIYFTVTKGTISGIMGEDNSGKTVLIKILTGELRSSLGTSIIGLTDLKENRIEYLSKVAYCPEFNAIHDHMSAFQMMQLMGRLRGIPSWHLDIHVRHWLQLMGFDEKQMHAHCSSYPPGMQRRLCAAMTFIGNCEILIFDDPTDTLDAMEHARFWEVVELIRATGQAIIFTSKSAEECIQITDKIIVLRHGEIRAIGTPHQIYENYTRKWSIMIRFRREIYGPIEDRWDRIEVLQRYITDVFSNCQLKELLDNLLLYQVNDSDRSYPLSFMYRTLETAKKDMPELIQDYFIQETSLDELFGNISEDIQLKLPKASMMEEAAEAAAELAEDVNRIRPRDRIVSVDD